MAYDELLADRMRMIFKDKSVPYVEKKMMGGLIFMVNDKMCVGIDIDKKTESDRLMVRVGKLPYEELLGAKGSRKMDFTGKPMRGFLFIDPEGFDIDDDLDFWVAKALEFNKLIKYFFSYFITTTTSNPSKYVSCRTRCSR